jgi:hypothetical protein
MERLGIVDDLVERRESIAASLSPSARHQAFPTIYARPVPVGEKRGEQVPKLSAEIAKLKGQITTLQEENARLRTLQGARFEDPLEPVTIPIVAVMHKFCDAMNEAGLTVGDEKWSLELLRSARRAHPISHPRHVCMWLVRTVCSQPSFPKIGHAFGGMDHTSVMNGLKKTPAHLSRYPALLKIAAEVMRSFGVVLARLEEGGKP